MTVINPEFCLHQGDLMFTSKDEHPRCALCGTRIALMAVDDVERLTNKVADLQRKLADCRKGITRWEDKP